MHYIYLGEKNCPFGGSLNRLAVHLRAVRKSPEPVPQQSQQPSATFGKQTKAIVVTSGMLVFISFWRASAIVLCDLASTAYYIGGIVEQAGGKYAPYFLLAVMLFSYCVRAVYVESCSMFTRGGVYRVVKEAMGSTLAKLSVSALMFDYILTGPTSGVSAGQYIAGLANELLKVLHASFALPPDMTAAVFAIAITIYFWWQNTLGIEESSGKAIAIMQVTTVMAVTMIIWCGITLFVKGGHLPPFVPSFNKESLGWLNHMPSAHTFGALGIIIAFGHSILAMSGEESLAQINREIEAPKLKNLLRTGFIIFIYSLLLTSLVSVFRSE